MESSRDPPSEIDPSQISLTEPFEEFLDLKAKIVKTVETEEGQTTRRSGSYVSQLERVVSNWIDWSHDRGVTTIDEVTPRHLWQYADYLSSRVDAQPSDSSAGISAATAWQYYRLVSAYLNYCVQWEYLDDNPANKQRIKNKMPDKPSQSASDQQFWSSDQRVTLIKHVDLTAREAIATDPSDQEAWNALRNRALAYVIGYTGVRGAEVLASPTDDRRTGIYWSDIDFDNQTLSVYGKNQKEETAPLTEKPVRPLKQWYQLLDPPHGEWPVFPSFHLPTLRDRAREQLQSAGIPDKKIAEVTGLSHPEIIETFRERELDLPAITTAGGRNVLKRLSNDANVDCSDDSKSYLTLHGARRGVGQIYYDAAGVDKAQRALRHQDPATTSKMYSHKAASELSKIGTEIFE